MVPFLWVRMHPELIWGAHMRSLLHWHKLTHRPIQTCEPDPSGICLYSTYPCISGYCGPIIVPVCLYSTCPCFSWYCDGGHCFSVSLGYPGRKVAIFPPGLDSLATRPTDGRRPSRTTLAVWEGHALSRGAFCGRHRGPSDRAPGTRTLACCWEVQAPHCANGCKVTVYLRKQALQRYTMLILYLSN